MIGLGPTVPSHPLDPHDCRMFAREHDEGPPGLGGSCHKCDVCGAKLDLS